LKQTNIRWNVKSSTTQEVKKDVEVDVPVHEEEEDEEVQSCGFLGVQLSIKDRILLRDVNTGNVDDNWLEAKSLATLACFIATSKDALILALLA
jgi:hypothetical protein